MRNLFQTTLGSNQKREWKHFNKLMFLQDECGLELDGQVENDFTISIVAEDDASSTLYHLPNEEPNNDSTAENGQSSHQSQTKSINTVKKRKTANFNSSSSSINVQQARNALMNSNLNPLPKFNPLSEEEIFGHSIAASLKKFDDKKKEMVKLKLQEVIVQYLNE